MNNSEGQTQEPVGEMLEKIASILYDNKSDEGDEGSWINSEDYYKVAEKIEKLFDPPPAPINTERFKMPTYKQIIDMAIVFNDGHIDHKKLSDMVSMCQFVIDRLYENGDMLIPSSKENQE